MNNYLEKKENSNSNEYRPASLTYVETCFVVSVYSFMFFMSFVGNSVILLIICKKRRRTVNNLFLANMIISNLIYTLFAPFTFVTEIMNNESEWIFPDFLCPCLSYLNELSVNLNTLTMCVSSVERLIAFICPLKSKLPKKVCYLVIALIWTLSISLALPWTILMKIEQLYAFSHDVSIDEAKETPDLPVIKSPGKPCVKRLSGRLTPSGGRAAGVLWQGPRPQMQCPVINAPQSRRPHRVLPA